MPCCFERFVKSRIDFVGAHPPISEILRHLFRKLLDAGQGLATNPWIRSESRIQ